MADLVLEARYRTWAALHRDLDQQLAMGGLLLRTTSVEPPQFSPLTLKVVVPGGDSFDIPGQVLQVIPGQGVAMQIGPEGAGQVDALSTACQAHVAELLDEPDPDDPKVAPPVQRRTGGRITLSTDPVEMRRQLEQMTVNQKRQVALGARREGRFLLIKDKHKAVHPFVLKNPGITLDEVELFSKMPGVNPDALRMIAKNRDWTRAVSVCRNLVRNPKTPMQEALMLLDRLPLGEIRIIAKAGNVRMPLVQAARKKVNQ